MTKATTSKTAPELMEEIEAVKINLDAARSTASSARSNVTYLENCLTELRRKLVKEMDNFDDGLRQYFNEH